jgi:hypothetical protein
MVTLDRIRLTGLLRKKPWKQGFFHVAETIMGIAERRKT